MLRGEITGGLPERPVLAPCGHIFDRGDIESHLETSQTCPIDGKPLSIDQLMSLSIGQAEAVPALLRATSFESMISGLRMEWNALQKENHDLRVRLATAQRELAEALYEVDAAKRVIAKLLAGQAQAPEQRESPAVNALQASLVADAKKRRRESRKLDNERKACAERDLERYKSASRTRLASLMDGAARFTAVDTNTSDQIILGTSNGLLMKIGKESAGKQELVVSDSEIVSVESSANGSVLVASANGVFVVGENGPEKLESVEGVVAAMWHPNEEMVIVVYRDGRWKLCTSKDVLASGSSNERYSCAAKHPDGVLLFVGVEGGTNVRVWNLADAKLEEVDRSVFEMPDVIRCIDVAANGKLLAIGCAALVRVVDLTKQQVLVEYNLPCESLAFDKTGYLLAVMDRRVWHLCCTLKTDPPVEFSIAECQFGRFTSECFVAVTCDDCIDITEPEKVQN